MPPRPGFHIPRKIITPFARRRPDRSRAQRAGVNRTVQLRLWFSSFVLICAVRRIGLRHTQFARPLRA